MTDKELKDVKSKVQTDQIVDIFRKATMITMFSVTMYKIGRDRKKKRK